MVRKIVSSVLAGVVLMGAMAPQALTQVEKGEVYAAATSGGVRFFSTYKKAASFARSISGRYYYSITKSGRTYRVDYWGKYDHG
jgi:hypothetical protein